MTSSPDEHAAYYASLATKRAGAGIFCRNSAGHVLLLRPTYKATWEVPGGVVEADEAPRKAADREVREELGLALPIGRLLVVDWVPAAAPKSEGLMFLFDGGILTDELATRFNLPRDELAEWRFVPPDGVPDLVSEGMARRLAAAAQALGGGGTQYLEGGRAGLDHDDADPYAAMRDGAWELIENLDAQLARGEIDEASWHTAVARAIVPAYLAAETPWEGSGKSGTTGDWEYGRSLIAHAIDRSGSFLDVGCANGYLLECLPRWTPHTLKRYGLDIAPELAELARQRLPELRDQVYVGNALHWQPHQPFTYIRTGLEYVPTARQPQLVDHLLSACDRLIIGVFNEEAGVRRTEARLRSWGYLVAGRSERIHPYKAGMEYRVVWVDADVRSRPRRPR